MLNFLTFAQLDYQALRVAGLNDSDIWIGIRQNYVNGKLMKIYGALDGVNDPWYDKSTQLTASVDQELLKDVLTNSGTISAIDATASTITRSSGSFVAGSMIYVVLLDNAVAGVIHAQWSAKIVTGGATATFSVITGTAMSLGGYGAAVLVVKSPSTLSASISALYVKSIQSIYDDNYTTTPGELNRKFDEIKDPARFFDFPFDMGAQKRVGWMQQGDTIKFTVGPSAIALGNVYANYRGKPALFTTATSANIIDIPPELNQVLIDESSAAYLTHVGKPLPNDLQSRLATYETEIYNAKDVDEKSQEAKSSK